MGFIDTVGSVCANMFASIVRVKGIAIPIVPNLLISQMVIVVPVIRFVSMCFL